MNIHSQKTVRERPKPTFIIFVVVAQIAALAALSGRSLAQVSLPSGPPYTTVSATGNSGSVAVGDMNGDGNNDVIIGRYENQNVQVVPGDGQGGFGSPAEFPAFPSSLAARPRGVVIGDINVDGKLDVVTFDYATTGAFSVLFGDGAGNLGNPTVYNVYDTRNPGDTRYVVWSAAIGDVNGDGKPDLIVGAANNFFTSKGDVWVLLNGGSGNFAPPTIVWTRIMGHGDVPAQFVTVGDLDGDGNGDIVVTSGFGQFGSGNAVTVLYGNGTGTFPSTVGMPFPLTPNGRANQAQGVVIADMDGIGLRDLVVSTSDIGGTRTGGVTLFRSTGARTFDGGTTYPTLFFRNGMGAVGDLNGDSHPDVVVTGASSGDSFAYFLNNGSGGLGAPVYVPGLRAFGLALGDLTSSGPGTLDVVVGTIGAGTQMLQNGPAGQPANQPPVAVAGADQSFSCVVGSVNVTLDGSGSNDPDGNPLAYNWWLGASVVSTDASFTTSLGAGTHTFTLTVSDGKDESSDQVTVTVELDQTPPVLTVPADITVTANSPGGYSGPIGTATAEDACGKPVTITSDAPAIFPLGETTVHYTAVDFAGNASTGAQKVTVKAYPIIVDIKPGSSTNVVNFKNKGVIPVAVLTTSNFDATTLDVASLRFGPGGAAEAHGKGHFEDVDNDGDIDLMLHFDTQASGLTNSDASATLVGKTLSGIPVAGSDVLNVGGGLGQSYPNPFNPTTQISFTVPVSGQARLVVVNSIGQEVATLFDSMAEPGRRYTVTFDGHSLSSGIYIYRLSYNGTSFSKKMLLVK